MVNCVECDYKHHNYENNGDDKGRLIASDLVDRYGLVAVENGFICSHDFCSNANGVISYGTGRVLVARRFVRICCVAGSCV